MPNKPIRREPVANPIIMVNRPIRDSMVDRAEAYNFANHKTGAGQLSLRKSGMLRMALVPARTKAIICKKEFIYRGLSLNPMELNHSLRN